MSAPAGGHYTELLVGVSVVRRLRPWPAGMDEKVARKEEQSRIESWVERLAAHSRSLGLEVDTEVEIHTNWREAIT